jgi:hypothetical protein
MMTTKPETPVAKDYALIKSFFDQTKRIYNMENGFLDFAEEEVQGASAIQTVRKANLATFMSSVFGSGEVGFYLLNEYFLEVFVGDRNRLLKQQAALFLDLKTQCFISALAAGQRERELLLDDLFPEHLKQLLLNRRYAETLATSEATFIDQAKRRREILHEESKSEKAISELSSKYLWDDFLRSIKNYVSRNFDDIVGKQVR